MAFSLGSVFIEVGARNERLRRDFSQTQKIMNGFKSSVLSFAGPLTAALSIGALGADAYNTITNFEQAVADLGSIAGKSSREMQKLTESAIKIGAESSFTATQVVQLQTELAKLGFNESEILNSTKAIGDFSVAVGTDAASAAALGGAALRSFGLDASKANDVMNTLAVATTKSALDFSKLQTALPYVGTAANQMGISIEKTTAILGLLSDRGVRAETAGTSLRDILLDSAKSGLTFEESIKRVTNSQDKLKTATDIFGKTSAGAAVIIAENSNQLNRLQASITNADGALKTMTDQRLDTVKGKVELMTSAWEGFILSVDKGDGVFSRFAKSALGTITDLIDDLKVLNDKGFEGLQEKGRKNLSASVKQDQLNRLGAATGQRSVRGSGYGKSFQDELKGATTVLDNLKEKLSKTNVDSAEFAQIQADIEFSQKRVNDLTGKYTGIIDNNTKATTKNNAATGATIKQLPTLEQQIAAAQERIKQLSIQYQTKPSDSLLKNINSEISKLKEKEGILADSESLIKKLSGIPPTFAIKGSLDFPLDEIRADVSRKLAEIDASIKIGIEADGVQAKIGVLTSAISAAFAQGGDITDPFIQDLQAKLNAIKPPTFKFANSLDDFKFDDVLSEVRKKLETTDLNVKFGLQDNGAAEKISIIKEAMLGLSAAGLTGSAVFTQLNGQLNLLSEGQLKMEALKESMNDLINGSLTEGLSLVGTTLGNLFNGDGGAAAFFGGMLNIVGDFAVGLGRQMIAIGAAGQALKKAFTNPIAASIAGVALIALGTIAKNYVAKGLPSLAIGTDYVKKDGMAILHKGEKVVPADVVKGGYTRGENNMVERIALTVAATLRGPDLAYALQYAAPINNRFR